MVRQQRVNYDLIAHLYDEPGRDHALDENLVAFLKERTPLQVSDLRILDMGCGTGKQLAADRPAYPAALMVGLDRFQGMLREACKRCPDVCWTQGSSARTPFKGDSFDYITNQFSYQHVPDKAGVINETYRLLRTGGRFVMLNIDPWSMTGWLIYKYFPVAKERDFVDFLPADTFVGLMETAGFTDVQVSRQHRRRQEDLRQFLQYALSRYRTSQLMVISDDEHRAGIDQLAEDIKQSGGNFTAESESCLITVIGNKSPG